jgi:hypothetical protein
LIRGPKPRSLGKLLVILRTRGVRVALLTGLLVLVSVSRAVAQPAAPDAAPAASAAPADRSEDRSDETWRAYDQAFEALVAGNRARAKQLLDALLLVHPEHPAAGRARVLASLLAAPLQALDEPSPAATRAPDRGGKTNAARAELIVFQTIHGVFAGVELCRALDCVGPRKNALSLMTMGGLGLGLSIATTRGGIRPGDTELLDSGVVWGAWNGLGITAARDNSNFKPWMPMLVGQGLGLGLGGVIAAGSHPSAGQVALANSFGIWGTGLTFFTILMVSDHNQSASKIWVPLIIASDAGLLIGGTVARGSSISRGRSALIDMGGLLGLLLGGLIASGSDSAQAVGAALLLGTGAGLGVATLATSNWDRASPAPTLALTRPLGLPTAMNLSPMPLAHGGGGLSLGGRF